MGELAKTLGFWDIYLMSIGQIIGAGIGAVGNIASAGVSGIK